MLSNQIVQLETLFGADCLGRVEPDQGEIAVVGEDFLYLRHDLVPEALGVVLVCVVGVVPFVGPGPEAAPGMAGGIAAGRFVYT
jgi:hypothetical protein